MAGLALFFALLRQRQHFLLVLLALEVVIIFLMVVNVVVLATVGIRFEHLILVVLVMLVREARLGLALLVRMIRSRGNDLVRGLVSC